LHSFTKRLQRRVVTRQCCTVVFRRQSGYHLPTGVGICFLVLSCVPTCRSHSNTTTQATVVSFHAVRHSQFTSIFQTHRRRTALLFQTTQYYFGRDQLRCLLKQEVQHRVPDIPYLNLLPSLTNPVQSRNIFNTHFNCILPCAFSFLPFGFPWYFLKRSKNI
jgi:hypothetical protein